ncbi:hypothetical protein PFICI_15337 [Pestalotiopsis fici W106-1]|uniref:Uncharacterized protein n=1 Tax=Pestalotiopsis fici (strain W106-1 / CGMCC3.15140) TaxID=1229662 RepID=W3WG94_PESFW|nr:uncharacterized protein PFICI_15337 [Pestalotiopsis fici W106-1]ETS72945.1 hypothetical protein PFICI_15337 [Pestalotiopsis fici W106-1]
MGTNEADEKTLVISAPGAISKPYVSGVKVDGKELSRPILQHCELVGASLIEFDMSDTRGSWGTT